MKILKHALARKGIGFIALMVLLLGPMPVLNDTVQARETGAGPASNYPTGVPTNKPGVFTFEAPPTDFDPSTGSTADLSRYGYPARPDRTAHPDAYAQWAKVVRSARQYVPPRFTAKPGRHNGTSGNWSGTVATSAQVWASWMIVPESGYNFTQVYGGWQVPDVSGSSQTSFSSTWVGLDGSGSGAGRNQVEQIGTSQDALQISFFCGPSVGVPCPMMSVYNAWYELFPDNEQIIDSIAIHSGDYVYSYVTCTPETNILFFYIGAGMQYTSFYLGATYGCPGDTAEWIVERPQINGALPSLARFGRVAMTSEYYLDQAGDGWYANTSTLSFQNTVLSMTGSSGDTLSSASGVRAFDYFTWQNYN